MHKWIAALIAVSVVALGGCTSTPEPPPPEPVITAPVLTAEDVYILTLEDEFGPMTSEDKANFIDLGKTVCAALDDNENFYDIMTAMMIGGLSPEASGFIVGAAVPTYCPEYVNDMLEFADSVTLQAA